MPVRPYNYEIVAESRQVEEATSSLLHIILLHRTIGKIQYRNETSYSVGLVGTEDVDCKYIDFTYLRVNSKSLISMVQKAVAEFCKELQKTHSDTNTGTITLEFYCKCKGTWPFSERCVPWEIWNLHVTQRTLKNLEAVHFSKLDLGDRLRVKIVPIVDTASNLEYVPATPLLADVHDVYDTSLTDVQPFLFNIHFSVPSGSFTNDFLSAISSISSVVYNFIRPNLSIAMMI